MAFDDARGTSVGLFASCLASSLRFLSWHPARSTMVRPSLVPSPCGREVWVRWDGWIRSMERGLTNLPPHLIRLVSSCTGRSYSVQHCCIDETGTRGSISRTMRSGLGHGQTPATQRARLDRDRQRVSVRLVPVRRFCSASCSTFACREGSRVIGLGHSTDAVRAAELS